MEDTFLLLMGASSSYYKQILHYPSYEIYDIALFPQFRVLSVQCFNPGLLGEGGVGFRV